MQIFIPTHGRGPDKQFTYKALEAAGVLWKYETRLLVATMAEAQDFIKAGMPVTVHNSGPGIRASRQWVLDNAPGAVMMLDDDLNNWAVRSISSPVKYHRDLRAPLAAMDTAALILEDYIHCAIGHRQMANTQPRVVAGGRALRALGYRADIVRELGLRYELEVMEDFEMTLKLLTLGHENIIYYGVVQDQAKSDAPGGCQGLRTLELHNACARRLHEMFPKYVKLKEAEGWALGTRLDVTVQWKKALSYGN